MGLTPNQFVECRRRLYARGFPVPDETTGLYDIEAIDRWRMRQRPDLYPEVQPGLPVVGPAPRTDLGARFADAQKAKSMGKRFADAERARRAKTSARTSGPLK
jgi:hypothetical protein